jgi:dTDP-4-amino-4,6-dideoxygalactose transaminase
MGDGMQKINFFDLKRQYQQIHGEVEQSVCECMESCGYIEGPKTKALEQQLAAYLGVKHVITCGNGTEALCLALRSCGVKPGDEVITSPFSFFATAEAIAGVGAVPVFSDIRKEDLNLDPDEIEKKITDKTRAILPVHIFGAPADTDAINRVAKAHSLMVVEDAAQAIGASYLGRMVGTLGDAAAFSFYPTKNLGAFGDAGMVTTNSDEVATVCQALKAHAAGKGGAAAYEILNHEPAKLENIAESDDPLYDPYKYFNYLIGTNSRLDSMQAAVLLVKLKRLPDYNANRAAIAKRYLTELSSTPLKMTAPDPRGVSCWHQFAVLPEDKEEFIKYLGEHGISTGAFYPVPLHLQYAFRYLGYKEGSLPVAEETCRHSVCLPIFPELNKDEVDQIIAVIRGYYGM